MSALLETYWGDVVIDLDAEASPVASRNFLKLVKARQYTQCLVHRIHREATTQTNEEGVDEGKVVIACTGCPRGNGKGGASIDAYLVADKELRDGAAAADVEGKVETSSVRFLKSKLAGRGVHAHELVRGDVVALCIDNIPDTIGSQFGIVVESTHRHHRGDNVSSSSSGSSPPMYVSLGKVAEDDANVLDRLAGTYCDDDNAASSLGRPLVDIRVVRALVVDDPYDDPPGLQLLMQRRGVVLEEAENGNDETSRVLSSPSPDRPPTEVVSERVPVHEVEDELDEEKLREREELALQKEDKGRAIVLEMLGDLPDADIRAPENVLFVCKLNPVTQDEDLELIFSRFDPAVKVDIIRDNETGASLQYAFAEFATQAQAAEAYFKMNNALVDDRRIKVDFSQSVATIWDKYRQRMRRGGTNNNKTNSAMPKLGPSFDASRTRNGNGGDGGGGDDRRRDHYSRDGKSQSRRYESNGRNSSERQPSRQHHDDPRYDRSRGESRSSSQHIEEPRSRFGANEERDEFGRVKGWDSRNGGGNGDARRDERHGYSTSRRDRDEETSSVRHYGDDQRLDSRRDDGGRDRHDYRGRDGDRKERRLEARHEHQSEQRRYDDNWNSRRGRDEIAPRDRDDSPPANGRSRGEEKHRRHDSESPASDHRDRRRSESIESDTESRSSRRHRKRKKDKRKHHKKRKHRADSDDEDEEPDDERRKDDKSDEKRRTKSSKHRVDRDRSSDDELSRKHAKHRERKRSRRSRSRSRT
jgi:peptidyl-prolyl cis-trans isomerase-like 4